MDIQALNLSTKRKNILEKKGITTVEDVANYFPTKYYDFRKTTLIKDLKVDDIQLVKGKVIKNILKNKNVFLHIKDDNNNTMIITFFGMDFIYKNFFLNQTYYFGGKIGEFNNNKTMTNPFIYLHEDDKDKALSIHGIYKKIPNISNDSLLNITQTAIDLLNTSCNEIFTPNIIQKFNLMYQYQAYRNIHNPKDIVQLEKAKERFIFEDLFRFAFNLKLKQNHNKENTFKFVKTKLLNTFVESLPFSLTEGQKETLEKIKEKSISDKSINALVQGDVGTGKTMIAFGGCVLAKENGFQSVILCPTNVLASQHYEEFCERTKGLNIETAFLNSDTKTKEKKRIYKGLEDGTIDVVIGTHAILSDKVIFKNLALIVVDEEHRFGVKQREKLTEKTNGIHFISMSATPIPRTLALTIYGDNIDVYTIKTKPANRKEVQTLIFNNQEKIFDGIYRQFKEGHQSYIVCPMIDDSEELKSIEEVFKDFNKYCKQKGYNDIKAEIVTGKMKKDEVDKTIERFSNFESHVLISTTVIEVGVNVPNATVIVVQDAKQFGLAQLHQLRGRVGRGSYQSYCLLVGDKNNERLNIMTSTTDGFVIAQEDLKLRGTGDFLGTKQSGENKLLLLALANKELFFEIQKTINELFKDEKEINRYTKIYT